MNTLLRLTRLLTPFAARAVLATLLGTLTVLGGVGLLGASAFIIAKAALHPSVAELQVAIVGVRFFGISRGVFRYLERLTAHDVNFALLTRLRIQFYAALERQTPAGLTREHSGDLLSRVTGDIETLENYFIRLVYPPVTALAVLLIVTVFTGSFNARLGLTLALGLGVTCVFAPLVTHLSGKNAARERVALRDELQARLVEELDGMAELTALNLQNVALARFARLERRLVRAQLRSAVSGGLGAALNLLGQNLTLLAVLVVAIPLVREGVLDGVLLAVLALIAQASFEITNPLGTGAQLLGASLAAARRLFALLDAPEIDPDPATPLAAPEFKRLEFKQIGFSYAAERVLENFSLTLTPGKRVALVGSSGAGKTTVLRLAQRYARPQDGEIVLDGSSLAGYRAEDIRRAIAVIAQETFIFSATIRANLRLARPDASDEDLLRALEQAELGAWFARQEAGLGAWLGGQGGQLSGGERQRFAVARAILRDAQLWCLDEPTAHLDAATEKKVLDTLLAASRGRMLLWSTHRLVQMERMDEILVLQGGQVVERGKHADLVAQNGFYARLWRLQNNLLFD